VQAGAGYALHGLEQQGLSAELAYRVLLVATAIAIALSLAWALLDRPRAAPAEPT
jgi:hypothetical protein